MVYNIIYNIYFIFKSSKISLNSWKHLELNLCFNSNNFKFYNLLQLSWAIITFTSHFYLLWNIGKQLASLAIKYHYAYIKHIYASLKLLCRLIAVFIITMVLRKRNVVLYNAPISATLSIVKFEYVVYDD